MVGPLTTIKCVLNGYGQVLESLEAATELATETAMQASGLLNGFQDANMLLGLQMTMHAGITTS
jgi:hypothetical protein